MMKETGKGQNQFKSSASLVILVLTAVLGKDDVDTEELKEEIIEGAKDQIKEFVVAVDDDEEEDL